LDGAILRRFSNRIFIDLPKKEDIIKLIFMEYAGFIEVNKDETIGKYDTNEKKFVKDEENGSLLLKIKKDNEGNDELYDDIDNHCVKLIREKEDEDLQLDNPKQTQRDSFCFEMLKKRREESIQSTGTYSGNIIDKKSYEILFNDNYISLLSYGLNFKEVTKELLTASSNIDYINKKKEFVYKRLVLDVSALADIMVSKLFSNSDIRTFMRDRYFPLLSYESLKNEKKRYVVEINERTFHVDTQSLDSFSPLINDLKTTQPEDDEYGNLTNGSEAFQKYTDIKYSDLFQLEKSSYFDMYWVQPSQLAKMEFNKKKETVAVPNDCVDLVNSTFLKATGDDGAVSGHKSREMYEKSTDLNLFVKLKDKSIFIETQYKYLCNLQVSIQSTFDQMYTSVKWYFNKESNSNQDYFQKVTSLSIPDVSGINTKKIKTFGDIEKLTKIDQKGGSRWSSIKKFLTGSYWTEPWPKLRKMMYFFKWSKEDLRKQINKEYFEEEMRIEEFRKKEYENLLFENQEKESKDNMSKILMNELNLKNIFFTEEQKCLNLNELCVKLIERMHEQFQKMSYFSYIEMKYLEMKFQNIQLEDDEFRSKKSTRDQLRAHTDMIEKKRMELRQLIQKNFQIDRIIAKAVEKSLKSSSIQSYKVFKTSFADCFIEEVDNIAYLSVLFPNETNDDSSAESIFVIEKSKFEESPFSSVVYIPVWSGKKEQLVQDTDNVLNCSLENSRDEITKILSDMTDNDEYIVYYKFQAGDNLNKFKSELNGWITDLFSNTIDEDSAADDDDEGDDVVSSALSNVGDVDDDVVSSAVSEEMSEADIDDSASLPGSPVVAAAADDDDDTQSSQTDKFNWNKCCLPYKLKIDKIEKSTQYIVPENPKLFRTFQINPRYSIITLLDETKKDSYFQASTIKTDYAEMKYYEDTRIAPDTKERKKKAYKEMALKYEWAKDLKIEE
jgi:hypothetical protein